MSILIETSSGDIVIDLFIDECPVVCTNFIKLCKLKKYNHNLFFNVQRDLLIQSGDPTGTGKGGSCVWHVINNDHHPYFKADLVTSKRCKKHDRRGLVSFAMIHVDPLAGQGLIGSQFFITTADNSEYLDGRARIFGEVAEGMDVIDKINSVFTDHVGRPLQDVRIKHTIILDDPFPDPDGLIEPERSPSPPTVELNHVRLADDEIINMSDEDPELADERKRKQEANSRALALEMMGDIPFAEIKPPENVLFVCKLNPVTRGEDLELIFGRFGEINSCEVIRDKVTNNSLCYAFIEYNDREHCESAYFKMDNVLIDDRRIKVDFSQSVSKLHKDWISSRNSMRVGYGGFANLEKRTQYRLQSQNDDDSGASGTDDPSAPNSRKLVFGHDSDLLQSGQEVNLDPSQQQNETLMLPRASSNPNTNLNLVAAGASHHPSKSRVSHKHDERASCHTSGTKKHADLRSSSTERADRFSDTRRRRYRDEKNGSYRDPDRSHRDRGYRHL